MSWQPGLTLEDVERDAILKAYSFYRTKTNTAEALGISLNTLTAKLERYISEGHFTTAIRRAQLPKQESSW